MWPNPLKLLENHMMSLETISETWDMNVFIYKGQLGNKDFENKKLTLLVVVWW